MWARVCFSTILVKEKSVKKPKILMFLDWTRLKFDNFCQGNTNPWHLVVEFSVAIGIIWSSERYHFETVGGTHLPEI